MGAGEELSLVHVEVVVFSVGDKLCADVSLWRGYFDRCIFTRRMDPDLVALLKRLVAVGCVVSTLVPFVSLCVCVCLCARARACV